MALRNPLGGSVQPDGMFHDSAGCAIWKGAMCICEARSGCESRSGRSLAHNLLPSHHRLRRLQDTADPTHRSRQEPFAPRSFA